jgi:hypothetical protein
LVCVIHDLAGSKMFLLSSEYSVSYVVGASIDVRQSLEEMREDTVQR